MSRSQALSSFGAAALEHEASVFARHSGAEAMCLCAASVVGLKGALRHRNEFSFIKKTLRLIAACVYVKKPCDQFGFQSEVFNHQDTKTRID